MNQEFAPFEESLELKEMGFDELCFGYYFDNQITNVDLNWVSTSINPPTLIDGGFYTMKNSDTTNELNCTAPIYSQVFKWFMENHKIDSSVMEKKFVIESDMDLPKWFNGFKNYDETKLGCLRQLIKKVKKNG